MLIMPRLGLNNLANYSSSATVSQLLSYFEH